MKHLKLFGVIVFVLLLSLTGCKDKDGDKNKVTPTSLDEVETWIKEL